MKTPITDKAEFRTCEDGFETDKKVVPSEVARQLEQDLNTCKRALEKIRDEDYRGNKHSSHFIARKALEEL